MKVFLAALFCLIQIGCVPAYAAAITEDTQLYDISPDRVEQHTITPQVCNHVGNETRALATIMETGADAAKVKETLTTAIGVSIRKPDQYVALWMVAEARDHLRDTAYSAEVDTFLKANPGVTRVAAMGSLAKIACSHNEGEIYKVPMRVPVVDGKRI